MDGRGNDNSPKQIPAQNISVDPAAEDLLASAAMKPYVRLALTVMSGQDSSQALEAITALPLQNRYVWRVASALKWAFVDLETLKVEADRQTLSVGDQKQLADLLQHRPLQFCLFLSALFGQKQMERMLSSAIKNSRAIGDLTESDE